MSRLLVFNADDLGRSAEANEGIATAAAAGFALEASLMVTCGASSEAGARTGLGTGLHFCLTEGRALTGRMRGLTDSGGRFRPLPWVVAACLARVPSLDEVRRELRAQLDRARALGARVGHLNGHHHVHLLPVVRDAVIDLARSEGFAHVRAPGARQAIGGLRGRVVAWLGRGFRRAARDSGLRTLPLRSLPLGAGEAEAAELMLHPCAGGEEVALLTDPLFPARLLELGIRPARYAETEAVSEIL
ncbi:MAG TPA: ChbG/HpnK family deacetylase [Planctomycetota bacterium]|nr:ChbG/HpnK family deacetylase [Planctomycetota bacterium]